jgi:hypothetical protein
VGPCRDRGIGMAKRVGTLLQRRRRSRTSHRCDSPRNDRTGTNGEEARLESGRPSHEGRTVPQERRNQAVCASQKGGYLRTFWLVLVLRPSGKVVTLLTL